MKKLTNSTTSQVKACPPPMAMAPMVSTTTMAEMRKKIVSSRVSSRRSLARSASPASVDASSSGWTVATGDPPPRTCRHCNTSSAGAGRQCRTAPGGGAKRHTPPALPGPASTTGV